MHRADRQFLLTSIFVLCTLIVTLATMFAHAQPTHWYVSTSGSNGNGGTSTGDAWRTITYAMQNVPTDGSYLDPHIIHVAPGTYTYETGASNNETFPLMWGASASRLLHYVYLVGDDRDTTIIDYRDFSSSGSGTADLGILEVYHESYHITGVTISTLTIRNGYSLLEGGGIFARDCDVHVTDCVIEDGYSEEYGGGIYALEAELFATECTVQGNEANYGGGIACVDSTVEIKGCLIQHNETFFLEAGPHGGGIFMESCGDDCLIRDCDILENQADPGGNPRSGDGGGIYLIDSSPHIAHNNIRATSANRGTGPGNTARCGAGIYMAGDSNPLIDGWNEIAENWAWISGGGLYANHVSSTPVIEGNEFFWNWAYDGDGGAIFSNMSNMYVQNNWIGWNEANGSGGGVYCVEGSGSVHSIYDINWIHSNTADNTGGGICFLNGDDDTLLSNNNIFRNVAASGGDGIHLEQSAGLWLQDNGVWDNGASNDPGEGIRIDGGTATLFNNLVFSSTSNDDQAVGVYVRGSTTLTIRNLTIADHSNAGIKADAGSSANIWVWDCIIWGNATSINVGGATVEVFYTDIQGGWAGTGSNNKNTNPLFVCLPGALGYPEGYFLSQIAAGQGSDSPCVDEGSVSASSYFTGDYSTRTDAVSDTGQIDMGYHYLHEGATYIELEEFKAKALHEKVLITWTTGTEIDNAGFDIYRKEETGANLVKMNASLIPAQGTLGGGASYSFVDANVECGTKYLYYLVDIDVNGRTTAHGPVTATPYSLRLPSLQGGDGGARENVAPMMAKLNAL